MKSQQPQLLTPWRRLVQWVSTLIILLLPFLRFNGQSGLRIDVPSFSFYLLGKTFRIEELYLFWLAAVSFIFLFLLLTLVLGRVWCGWACPQTTLTDLTEGVGRILGMRVANNRFSGSRSQKTLLHLFFMAAGFLVGANLVWYFVSPYDFFPLLLAGKLGPWPLGSVIAVAVLVYLDLAFLRRLFCKEFCPYGRFQTVLVDSGTLTLWYHPDEAERCIDCGACVRTCPMGIDIRKGYQVECINCAKCLDACRSVMARLRQPGIIRYTFGDQGRGWRSLITIRTALVLLVFITVSTSLVVASFKRSEADLKVSRVKTLAGRKLPDNRLASFFTGYLAIHTRKDPLSTFTVSAYDEKGEELEIRGPVRNIALAQGERMFRFNFALVTRMPGPEKPLPVVFVLQDKGGRELDRTPTFVPATMEP